jgi:AraC-like DNA-binding protein
MFSKMHTMLSCFGIFNRSIRHFMQPVLEHLPLSKHHSFFAGAFCFPYFPTPWHYHPEYELVLVVESYGQRFVGNAVDEFSAGDLSFIGANVPHVYTNDKAFYEGKAKGNARSVVIHFREASIGTDFLSLPEMEAVRDLLQRSKKGLNILGATRKTVTRKMQEMLAAEPLDRLFLLLDILKILAQTKDYNFISETEVAGTYNTNTERLRAVIDWTMQNFGRNVSLSEVAAIAAMTRTSFCRYFRQATKRSFSDFVAELRLNHAAKLLRERPDNVATIGLDCGYENVSHFNRQFKAYYKQTPKAYRKQFLEKA